ncbi:MAG TPA: lipocalin-like domain-containing protein [Marinobacterium sp.]|nr:lipocalin-like domain-containing protein [Marinobacterium sp.]
MKTLMLSCLVVWSGAAFGQSFFFDSADPPSDFAQVVPGVSIAFPQDHAAHSDFRLEWWYLTGNLSDEQGRDWGVQWTLFRQALDASPSQKGWSNSQMWMGHAAVTTPDGHRFAQRLSRGGIGQAGVSLEDGFSAWIDDWRWRSDTPDMLPARLNFAMDDMQVSLELESSGPFILQGDQGFSQKAAGGQASYYYSLPYIRIVGSVTTSNGVHALAGEGWLDREWSSQPLSDGQLGWDWFSLHLEAGEKLMVYQLRDRSGAHWLSGTWIDAQGRVQKLNGDEINLNPRERRELSVRPDTRIELPLDWVISLPKLGREIRITPLYDNQWMATAISYWEGVVIAQDSTGKRIGRGYMELTGYQ